MDARIAGRVAVRAAGLELIAQGGPVHEDVDADRRENGDEDAGVDLGAGKQLIEAQLGGGHALSRHILSVHEAVSGFIDVTGLGVLYYIFKIGCVEEPGDHIGRDPVGHDAGQHLIDIQQGLDESGNRAPERPRETAADKGQQPDQEAGHGPGGDGEGHGERRRRAHQVLARRADVEKAGLEGDRDAETGHDQRRGAKEHIAEVCRVEAPGQRAGGVPPGAEDTREEQLDALRRPGKADVFRQRADDQHQHAAHHEADDDGQQGGEELVEALRAPERFCFLAVSHEAAPAFPMLRRAPAI